MTTFTDAFTRALLRNAESDPRIIAITAAMAGPTGLLPFEARFPERFIDVGIAEQHAVTAAAGMAMAGMRPVVAVYSTFFSRAFDQANLDVGLHRLPVVMVLDRAGITGDDGPSHHGVLDMALALSIPGMTVFAPSSAPEVEVMLDEALKLDGPSIIRFPKTPAPRVVDGCGRLGPPRPADPHRRRLGVHPGRGEDAHRRPSRPPRSSSAEGIEATVWDVRVVSDPDPAMVDDAARHRTVITAEDGVRHGGAGMFLADALAQVGEPAGPALRSPRWERPATFIAQGRPDRILAELGLDGPGLARAARAAVRAVDGELDAGDSRSPARPLPARVDHQRRPRLTRSGARPQLGRCCRPNRNVFYWLPDDVQPR